MPVPARGAHEDERPAVGREAREALEPRLERHLGELRGKRLADMVVHGGTIYLAGQVADDLNADITTQARQVLARIDRLLAEAGSGKDRMLSATIYLPDMADFAAMNAVWEAWIVPGQAPARATVQAKLAASGYKIEIQVIAAQQPVRS